MAKAEEKTEQPAVVSEEPAQGLRPGKESGAEQKPEEAAPPAQGLRPGKKKPPAQGLRPGKKAKEVPAQGLRPGRVSERELSELREKAALADERYDRLLRLQADFENFRKRKEREKLDFIKYATETLVCDLVPILSNFERALATAENVPQVKSFVEGVELIIKQLKKVLKDHGIEEICPVGVPFDPYRHEAIEKVITDEHPEGHILEVIQTGYALSDRVIQPAGVKVAAAASETEQSEPASPTSDEEGESRNHRIESKTAQDTAEEEEANE